LISMSATMIRTDLFRSLGGFDEIMTAAEDYDLWLRILIDREAGLVDELLVTRRGGHCDQTLATTPAIDRFRILALAKLLADDRLSPMRRAAAVEVLAEKCRIYVGGLIRRGRIEQAHIYERIADQAQNWRAAEISCATESLRSALHEIPHEC